MDVKGTNNRNDLIQNYSLEGISCSDILQLLANFCRCSVQLLRNTLLLGWVESIELFTEVSVNDILERIVTAAVGEMVSATQRRIFSSHVHLQVLEEVVVLHAGEGDQHAHTATESSVHQAV